MPGRLSVVVLVVFVLAMACAPPPAPPPAPTSPPTPVAPPAAAPTAAQPAVTRIGYPSLGGNLMALWTAQEAGLFAKHGLSTEMDYIAGSPNTIKALLAGDVQYAVVGASASVRAALGGSDVVLIATAAPGLAFRIYGRPEIQSLQDLRGKRLVQSIAGTDPDVALHLVLQQADIPFDDVQYVRIETGGDPARLAALQASGAEAVILAPGSFGKAEKDFGLHVVSDVIKLQIPYEQAAVATRRAYVDAHPDEVQRFVRAFTESLSYVREHRAETLAATRKYSQVDDPAVLDETYDYYVGSVFPSLPYVSEAGIQTLLDLVAQEDPKAAGHTPAEYIDSRFVKALD